MTAKINVPLGFIAGDVPEAVRKLVPDGIQSFRFVPAVSGQVHSILCLAVSKGEKLLHTSKVFYDRELDDAALIYERFILPASEALKRRAAA